MNLKAKNKLTIGLTGGILCGKTTALYAWEKAGAFVLSCDGLAREISAHAQVQKKIAAALGTTDTAQLSRKVFSNSAARKKLESILHPLIYKEIAARLKKSTQPVRVVEVPLLFEAGWDKFFDLTVTLITPDKLLAARAKKRKISTQDLALRQRAQLPQNEKAERADICLLNNTDEKQLAEKITCLQNAFNQIYNVK